MTQTYRARRAADRLRSARSGRAASLVLVATSVAWLAACSDAGPGSDAEAGTDGTSDVQPGDTDARDGVDGSGDAADAGDLPEHDAAGDTQADTGPGGMLLGLDCPGAGRALAAQIPAGAEPLDGPAALGGAGDYVLMNDRAAFVVQGLGEPHKTYWYYGGQPIDAVALRDCRQAGPERFDELGIILGRARLDAIPLSSLRGLRIDAIEVVSDGSDGGPARIRARGADDYFWLLELELIKRAFLSYIRRGYSDPLGVEVTVDYVLDPGSKSLRIETTVANPSATPRIALTGLVAFLGDTSTRAFYVDDRLPVAGLDVALGVPALVSLARDHAMAITIADARVGMVSISGVDALVDVDQFLGSEPVPAGGERTDVFVISVGEGGANSAMLALSDAVDRPLPGLDWSLRPVQVQVVDRASGDGLPGVEVIVEQRSVRGDWSPVDAFYVGPDGRFDGEIVTLSRRAVRLRTWVQGCPVPAPIELGEGDASVTFELDPDGGVVVAITDETRTPMPGRVTVLDGERVVARTYTTGDSTVVPVPPGSYRVILSRGFEYEPATFDVAVPPGETVPVVATLRRVVDTTGYLSMDGHVHASPSPDSDVLVPMRALSMAAENVEVAVSTDHEAIIPWVEDFVAAGMRRWTATVLGQEVTAPIPEHSNAYPFPARMDVHARGEPVDWRRTDMAGLFAASRARGAGIVQLNHPRNGCSYLCLVDYDRVLGRPRLEDPGALGFPPDAQLWSWDFDTVELMNGHANVFVDPDAPRNTGIFDDWMSFLNHGRRITALGVTDVHGTLADPTPVTYFASPTDDPAEFTDDMLVDALRSGRAMVSAGAFARVSIGDATLGDTAVAASGEVALDVRIEALPGVDVRYVQVLANCDEVAWVEATDPNGLVKFDGTVPLVLDADADAHVVVVAHGLDRLPPAFAQFDAWGAPRVITNPIYVDVDGDGYTAPGGRECTYSNPRTTRPKRDDEGIGWVDAIPGLRDVPEPHECR